MLASKPRYSFVMVFFVATYSAPLVDLYTVRKTTS